MADRVLDAGAVEQGQTGIDRAAGDFAHVRVAFAADRLRRGAGMKGQRRRQGDQE